MSNTAPVLNELADEHLPVTQKAVGSSPVAPAILIGLPGLDRVTACLKRRELGEFSLIFI
jgi:hypothetical protein